MKKSKIWIRVCVHLLLCITLGVHSSEFINPVTDDITRIAELKENIPKDYKIPVRYMPKLESGMCWVQLNVFYLEQSLQELAHKFGNISSNRYNIGIFIQMLRDKRYDMGSVEELNALMFDFECHYEDERWQTGPYFEFLEDFLTTAQTPGVQYAGSTVDCDPPPCPTETTTLPPTTTIITTTRKTLTTRTKYSLTGSERPDCNTSTSDCRNEKLTFLPEGVEISLLSLLLLIPIAAIVFLFAWKVKAKRNQDSSEQNSGEGDLFPGREGNTSPLADDISERNSLKRTVEPV